MSLGKLVDVQCLHLFPVLEALFYSQYKETSCNAEYSFPILEPTF